MTKEKNIDNIRVGIDIGSTTVKLVIVDITKNKIIYSKYKRHNAYQEKTLLELLEKVPDKYKKFTFKASVCGSGGKPIAEKLHLHFVQEVVANSAAIKLLYPDVKTAIELGGQDAKVIFFRKDESTNKTITSDMRMNGSCAGGTGAFIDEIATLLSVKTEKFNDLARLGKNVYEISGRCGVFAKTDIQPLLINGAPREDIALSTFHAIAKQTIGGLSQGLELLPPIIFEGGPLTFNDTLVRAFKERLNLKDEDIIIPNHPETFVAFGTAIATTQIFKRVKETNFKELIKLLKDNKNKVTSEEKNKTFFKNQKEIDKFYKRHNKELLDKEKIYLKENNLKVYLGIDSGSTTSKFVLIDENERLIDSFYANNKGDPIPVVQKGLIDMYEKYKNKGINLDIIGLGTTGYGENLFANAFNADFHTVETVSHATGCEKYYPDVSFILDIGGQDMKAIWINNGVITNICLNEACSSGCGSFLENFANNLKIKVEDIEKEAFKSKNPANLGSRCTVFMNSTIITEQRKGKDPRDIMAGLCRSIIENVFTKVVRISNTEELGNRIVVQGGTFKNMAVVKALEDYLQKEVCIAPYPGEMGAIGAALGAKRHIEEYGYLENNKTSFIGIEAVKNFKYTKDIGINCTNCSNRCSRTIMNFPGNRHLVTGNKCEKGEIIANTKEELKEQLLLQKNKNKDVINMFEIKEKKLFKEYDYKLVSSKKNVTIGIPRILEFYESAPFWTTFFKCLGYDVKLSNKSSKELYESGLQYVASDTVCFPAKLVHGHILDLCKENVDRIFFPYIMHMPPEGVDKLSPYVCSIVQGYPMVVRNFQSPESKYNIIFDTPVFHWFTKNNRKNQIIEYAYKNLNVKRKEAKEAFLLAEQTFLNYKKELIEKGNEIIKLAKKNNTFAVVLGGRPYHTDDFISHNISKIFTKYGISVLTVDSLEGVNEVNLKNTRIEITNNFHTRMLASAYLAAQNENLEYTQIVSFGCGHDAILSDEITRIITNTTDKHPLILKVDESAASGALRIRIESFIETVKIRRKLIESNFMELTESSPAKFKKIDKKIKTVLVPNISHEVSRLICSILEGEGFRPKVLPVGGIEEIKLGKKYVHNDICFPCQIVIGEILNELKTGNYKKGEVAAVMVKFQCDCRLSHYSGLLRKGLDSAGYKDVPILTTDFNDTKNNHPGVFPLTINAVIKAIWTFIMLDIIIDIVRRIRPYEINPGETDKVLDRCVKELGIALKKGIKEEKKVFKKCINYLKDIKYDRTKLKPRVLVTGELLVTYHPGSNFEIEKYLEKNGLETIFPRVTDQLRKDFIATGEEIKNFNANIFPYPYFVTTLFDHVQKECESIARQHPLHNDNLKPNDAYKEVKDIIPKTLSCGEGWLMAAEISHYAKQGVKSFIILQPFGCLPNHICGRGVIKKLKDKYQDINILPLDLDPDTSYANIENRLQMLIMNNEDNN